jgi:hypothetical protein
MAARRRRAVRCLVVAAAFAVFPVTGWLDAPTLSARQGPSVAGSPTTSSLTLEQQEEFLTKAKIIRTRGVSKGVTGTLRATLSDGTVTHDASIQTIDEDKMEFRSNRGTELNFKDSWRFNVAAYRLDRMLGLDMIPPSIERSFNGKQGAFTWWVDEVLMDEGERLKAKTPAPSIGLWNEQMQHVRLFDQLIANVDRNLGNLLIDKRWTVWMIDHSRAFRLFDKMKTPGNVTRCDRQVFEKLKALDEPTLKATMKDYLTGAEIRAMLQRRDEIVAQLQQSNVGLFDRRRQ